MYFIKIQCNFKQSNIDYTQQLRNEAYRPKAIRSRRI